MKSDVRGAFARLVSKDLTAFETIATDSNGEPIKKVTLNALGKEIVDAKLHKNIRIIYWLIDGFGNWHCLASNHNAVDYIAVSDTIEGCINDVNEYFDDLKKQYQAKYGGVVYDD